MDPDVLALVQELGAVAGLASGVGLVVLSALYVAHARAVERLRDWAGGAPESSRPGIARVARRRRSRNVVGILAVAGVVTFGVSQVIGGRSPATHTRSSPKPKRSPVVEPGSVTVAVLNATTVDGLAAALRDRVAAAGYRRGTIDVFPDQQLGESVVEYAPGHLTAAKAVGRTLAIGRHRPATVSSRALAGDATVIVVAGADKAGS